MSAAQAPAYRLGRHPRRGGCAGDCRRCCVARPPVGLGADRQAAGLNMHEMDWSDRDCLRITRHAGVGVQS